MTMPQGEGQNLGTATGYVEINTDRVSQNLQRAKLEIDMFAQQSQSSFEAFRMSLMDTGQQIASIGGALTLATAPLTVFQAKGIQTAASFQDSMAEIAARTGLVGDELDAVKEKALELGADSQFSAKQAADAFLQLLTSGSTVAEAMQQVDAVIMGAAASGDQLGFTADALTDVMAAFGEEAENSEAIMQSLIDATGASSATFSALTQGFANVGPIAREMGLSVEETAAILATFSENGIKGAEAGTQLRSMLNNMTRDTNKVQGMWKELGISMFDANGQARNLNDVIEDLNAAMANMTDEQRTEVIKTLAGTYGQMGLSALLASDGFDVMLEKMEGMESLSDIASKRLGGFSGAVESLSGSFETLLIRAFTPFIEKQTEIIKQIEVVVDRIGNWVANNQEATQSILRFMSILVAIGPTLVAIGQGFVVASMLLNPFNALLVGGSILVAALASDLFGLRTAILNITTPLRNLTTLLYDIALAPVFSSVNEHIREFNENLTSFMALLKTGFDPIEAFSIAFFNLMFIDQIIAVLEAVSTGFSSVISAIKPTTDAIYDMLLQMRDGVDFITAFYVAFAGREWAYNVARTFWMISNGISSAIETFKEFVSLVSSGWHPILAFQLALDNAEWAQRVTQTYLELRARFIELRNTISEFAASLIPTRQELRNFFLIQWLKYIAKVAYLKYVVGELRDTLVETFGSTINNVRRNIANIAKSFAGLSKEIFEFIGNVDFKALFEDVVKPLGKFAMRLWSLTSPIGIVINLVRAMGVDILGSFNRMIESVRYFFLLMNIGFTPVTALRIAFGKVGDVIATVIIAFQNMYSWMQSNIFPVFQRLIALLPVMRDRFFELAQRLVVALLPIFVRVGDFIYSRIMPAFQGLTDIISGLWARVAPGLGAFGRWFMQDIAPHIVSIMGSIRQMFERTMITISQIWDVVSPHLKKFGEWFTSEGAGGGLKLIGEAVEFFVEILDTAVAFIARIWDDIAPYLAPIADWFLTSILPQIVGFIRDTVIPIIQDLMNSILIIWETISPTLNNIYEWFVVDVLPTIGTTIGNFIEDSIWLLTNTLSGIWDLVRTPLGMFRDGIVEIIDAIVNVIQGLIDIFVELFEKVNQLGTVRDAVNNAREAVTGRFDGYGTAAAAVAEFGVVDVAKEFWRQVSPFAAGGSFSANQPMLVGEEGPELVTFNQGGNVTPSDETKSMLGGMRIQQIVINAETEAGGRAAASGFVDELERRFAWSGGSGMEFST